MDDWLYLHEIRHRDLVREADTARSRRLAGRGIRRHTTYRE